MYGRVFREVWMKYLVPPDHLFAELLQYLQHALVEVGLKGMVVLYAFRFHEGLNLLVPAPLMPFIFVPSDVHVIVGKKLGHLCEEAFEEFIQLLARRV